MSRGQLDVFCGLLPKRAAQGNVFSYGLRLTHCSFHVGSLHVRMCFFGCISLARVFILRVAEFSLSSYRSSKYFLAVDFIILRESFSINFCLCFLLPQGRRQPNPQDICFTCCGWPGHWSKTCNVSPYKYKQPSQLKPSPRPTSWAAAVPLALHSGAV